MTDSYRKLLDEAIPKLQNISNSARIDAQVLLQYVIEQDLAWLIANEDRAPTKQQRNTFKSVLERRLQGQPIAYITGQKCFWSLDLKVTPQVLIPRTDSETLVEQALLKIAVEQKTSVLDLGTGSGAIALSIAKERPLASVVATDKYPSALIVARENAQKNNISNIEFIQSDWYHQLSTGKFDVIVSNPPYIAVDDPHLDQGDLRFEPDCALTSQNKGLSDLQHLIELAPQYLKNNGWCLLEHGYDQANEVAEMLTANSFSAVSLSRDLNQNPRVTQGQWIADQTRKDERTVRK